MGHNNLCAPRVQANGQIGLEPLPNSTKMLDFQVREHFYGSLAAMPSQSAQNLDRFKSIQQN
jgi:hypothetical protein